MPHDNVDMDANKYGDTGGYSGGIDSQHVLTDTETDMFEFYYHKRTDTLSAGSGSGLGVGIENTGDMTVDIEQIEWYLSADSSNFRGILAFGLRPEDTFVNPQIARIGGSVSADTGYRRNFQWDFPRAFRMQPEESLYSWTGIRNEGGSGDDVVSHIYLKGSVVPDSGRL